MAKIVALNGSPSAQSRTALVLAHVERRLEREGHDVVPIHIRALPADDLLSARSDASGLASALASVERAQAVVIGTPIYKASFTGVLKTFLDLLPQFAFANKTILPLATGGTPAHILALDYGLRPVLASLGARHVVGSFFILDKSIERREGGDIELALDVSRKLDDAIAAFTDSVRRHLND
jgi:FMN reductase